MSGIDVDRLLEQLKRHEGYRQHPYLDTKGVLTIGIGRNLEHRGILSQEAKVLLTNDVNDFDQMLSHRFPVVNNLNPARRNVLVNMAFNMGMKGIASFEKMWAAIGVGDFEQAAEQMLDSKWAREDVAVSRSSELAEQMRTGEFV